MVQDRNFRFCLTNLIACDRQTYNFCWWVPLAFLAECLVVLEYLWTPAGYPRRKCVKKIPMPEGDKQVTSKDVAIRVQRDA